MAKLYDFKRLITKYSVNFTLVTLSEGGFVNGKYVEGAATETALSGAIVPMADGKIYQSGGTYTVKDRQLYMKTKIEQSLTNAKVRYKGNEYSIEQETDYDDYADAYIYALKWVGAFKDGDAGD